MVFQPCCKSKCMASDFPAFLLNGNALQFVNEFRYLGHVINNNFSDDDDIKREIRNLFMRTNILIRRYGKCSVNVKLVLFRAYCMCMYDVGLWSHYSVTVLSKLRSCYNKCIKMFFGYARCHSVTALLSDLRLPCFDLLFSNCVNSFKSRWISSKNVLVEHLSSLHL